MSVMTADRLVVDGFWTNWWWWWEGVVRPLAWVVHFDEFAPPRPGQPLLAQCHSLLSAAGHVCSGASGLGWVSKAGFQIRLATFLFGCGCFDPLRLSKLEFWRQSNVATIVFLLAPSRDQVWQSRCHGEFVGYCVHRKSFQYRARKSHSIPVDTAIRDDAWQLRSHGWIRWLSVHANHILFSVGRRRQLCIRWFVSALNL